MTNRIPFALFVAVAMILLAMAGRMGWADRQAVQTLLLVLPIIAVTRQLRGAPTCGCAMEGRA